jgi:hypothetical protein
MPRIPDEIIDQVRQASDVAEMSGSSGINKCIAKQHDCMV